MQAQYGGRSSVCKINTIDSLETMLMCLMLDYQLVKAFAAVLDEGGFARAAEKLCITQSAVSQRIKQLEEALGRALIIRDSPPRSTEAGEQLLRHYRQVRELEDETLGAISSRPTDHRALVSVAVNTDSLFVWFMDAIMSFAKSSDLAFEVLVAGHERTIEMLKSGAVAGCVSSDRNAVEGCTATRIGTLRYAVVASADYAATWFSRGFAREAAEKAPVVNLDRNDKLQYQTLYQAFGEPQVVPPAHYIPIADAYYGAIKAGLGYGLVPEIKAARDLASGALLNLDERLRPEIALYWHRWKYQTELLAELTKAVIEEGGRLLGEAVPKGLAAKGKRPGASAGKA